MTTTPSPAGHDAVTRQEVAAAYGVKFGNTQERYEWLRDAIAAALASVSAPPGFVLVPVSPTQEQVQAAADVYQVTSKLVGWLGPDGMYARIYRAMIAAKP